MTATIIPFAYKDSLVRTVMIDGEPWFVAADVCRVLDIKNARDAVDRLDEDEKGVANTDTLGGEQAMNVVSEAGVYRLVFTSRKPEAEAFKRWLAHEVLPSLRKTGSYRLPDGEAGDVIAGRPLRVFDAQLAMVKEARQIMGVRAATRLWRLFEFPDVGDREPVAESVINAGGEDALRRSGARRCLAHLLSAEVEYMGSRGDLGTLIRELLDSDTAELAHLGQFGLKILVENDVSVGIAVSTYHPWLERLFRGTPWSHGRWRQSLIFLPGAKRLTTTYFPGCVEASALRRRAVLIPGTTLDLEAGLEAAAVAADRAA
jgi:hypothetical protein